MKTSQCLGQVLRWAVILGCFCLIGTMPSWAEANSCGKRSQPSERANCICRPKTKKKSGMQWSKKTFTQRGTLNYPINKHMRQASNDCTEASKTARRKWCSPSSQKKITRFEWNKLRLRVRYIMGYRKGFCKISWRCSFRKKVRAYWCE